MTLVPVVSLTDDPTCTTNLANHVACVPPNSCTIATPRPKAFGFYTHGELGLKGIRLDAVRVVADRLHYRAYYAVLCMNSV